jgi:hypothetical protein
MATFASTVTSIRVVEQTALALAARAMSQNTFSTFTGNGLTSRSAHPRSGNSVNVLEDGRNSQGYQILGYCGKGNYDPVTRRVLWMGCGASSGNNQNWNAGAYAWNTRPIYTEATNSWTAHRAFQGADENNSEAIGHMYDGNCIDVANRRMYKLKKDTNRILVYDLDRNVMLNSIQGLSGISGSSTWGALEVVPTRGTSGAIWLANWNSSSSLQMWEYDIARGSWAGLFGSQRFGGITDGPVLSYNPRAFGGAGGVMLGNDGGAWTINCGTLAVASVGLPGGRRIDVAAGEASGFCRDPGGTGWLKFSDNAKRVYRWDGSGWQTGASFPSVSGGWMGDYIVVPIDTYGVVWLVSYSAGPSAFLYRA